MFNLGKAMQKSTKILIQWDWLDFGLCFRAYKQINTARYYIGIDVQLLWLDLYIQLFRK